MRSASYSLVRDGARVLVHAEQRLDRDDALERLKQVESEVVVAASFEALGGWPGLRVPGGSRG